MLQKTMLILIPTLFVITGFTTIVQLLLRYRGLKWVQAVVTRHLEGEDSEGKTYRSCLTYHAEGENWNIVDECGFGWKAHEVGQLVWVGYLPKNPGSGRVWRVWPMMLATSIFVAGFIVGYLVWIRGLV